MKNTTVLYCQRALRDSEGISPEVRADMYDLTSELLKREGLLTESAAASNAATDLRNAEAAQTLLTALLSAAHNRNIVP